MTDLPPFKVTGIDEYQQLALRTMDVSQLKDQLNPATIQLLFQIALILDTIGPQIEALKKYVGQGHPFPEDYITYGYADFPPKDLSEQQKILLVAALGGVGEAWEFFQLVAANILCNETLDTEKLIKEGGDMGWYAAIAAFGLKLPLSEVYGLNVTKLMKRFPEGWDKERSINREGRD